MKNFVHLSATALSFAPLGAFAWGALGHQTIGFVAMQFISTNTLSNVQTLLGSQFNFSLGPAATWADDVRSEAAFKFSAPFHFIDANDNPPDSCSVNLNRDRGSEGCVVSAIQNYTTRLLETSLSATQRQQALLFVTHFVGDIGQPLHDEALEVGGNDIDAICSGKSTNLHAAWGCIDTGMLTKSADSRFGGSAQTYAGILIDLRHQTGSFKSASTGWLSCITSSALKGTSCPLTWAQEANAFDCTNVFDFTTGQDLCTGAYFNAAIPVIDMQLAKQGFRLAAWLDAVFDS
ncbi:nuclease Le1 [Amylostereum chailletii]|nr:nuclease Le1 [Amylostereum chailletii]